MNNSKLANEHAIGFGAASHGPEAIISVIDRLINAHGKSGAGLYRSIPNLTRLFSHLNIWHDLQPLKEQLRQHLLSSQDLGAGDAIFGEPILEHSRVFLDVTTFSATEFCQYFSLAEPHFDCLTKARHLPPPSQDTIYIRRAGEALLDQILRGSEPLTWLTRGWLSIEQAAKRMGCSFDEIITMILDGRLPRVGRDTKRAGYAAVVVHVGFAAEAQEAVSAEVFAGWLDVDYSDFLSFCRRGAIPYFRRSRETGRKDQITLLPEHIRAFNERFISYRQHALKLSCDWSRLNTMLRQHNIRPFEDIQGFTNGIA